MQVVLVMFRADGERRSFSLPRDVTVVGRREDCDLRIPLGDVSRKHCRLIAEGDSLRLEDLGSSNGTYHNGQRVQEAIVNAGDTIQIGPVVFVCQIDGQPSDDELQPFDTVAAAAVAGMTDDDAIAADDLEEVGEGEPTQAASDFGDIGTDQEEQEQTLAGSGAADFDPMEVLQSGDDEEDDLVDFNIQDDEHAQPDDSVRINIDSGDGEEQSGNRA